MSKLPAVGYVILFFFLLQIELFTKYIKRKILKKVDGKPANSVDPDEVAHYDF